MTQETCTITEARESTTARQAASPPIVAVRIERRTAPERAANLAVTIDRRTAPGRAPHTASRDRRRAPRRRTRDRRTGTDASEPTPAPHAASPANVAVTIDRRTAPERAANLAVTIDRRTAPERAANLAVTIERRTG